MEHQIEKILEILKGIRINKVEYEFYLQELIAFIFLKEKINFHKEYKLSSRNRIDFFLPESGIGIEIKIGKPSSRKVANQIHRYTDHDKIRELVIVVERNLFRVPVELNGKKIHYISLSSNWGIAI